MMLTNKKLAKNLLTVALFTTTVSFTTKSFCASSSSSIPSLSSSLSSLSSPSLSSTSIFQNSVTNVSYISASEAKSIDDTLMSTPGFSIDQLMELAGLSVACSVNDFFLKYLNKQVNNKILIICGPGNNGGDGLVAARHLKHFGFEPTIIMPKQGSGQLFINLVKQCKDLDIAIITEYTQPNESTYSIIVDALFGFSFTGPARQPYSSIINYLATTKTPIISVDIPSGWNVDNGDEYKTGFVPTSVISLTTPKKCMAGYNGIHYVGGRFVPPSIASSFKLNLPVYGGNDQIALITNDNEFKNQDTSSGVSVMYVTTSSKEEAEKIGILQLIISIVIVIVIFIYCD